MTEGRTYKPCPLDVTSFYGVKNKSVSKEEELGLDRHRSIRPIKSLPHRLNNLLGPTQVWKVFKKQNEALDFAKRTRNGVMTFAFQQLDGARSFLVAHPKIFWHYDTQKNASQRCSYEIIPESTACKLYFDLEYETEYNPEKVGGSVVDTFIHVIVYFLSILFNIKIGKEHILNLDSSTSKKFSCHLIFQLDRYSFSDNRSVGDFVNFVCEKLNSFFESRNFQSDYERGLSKLSSNTCKCCMLPELKNTGCIQDIGLQIDVLKHLFVFDRKGVKRLICDLSVYSRNRHFRLFQNTKLGKKSHLSISNNNCYTPKIEQKHNCDEVISEAFFLDSLITYFRTYQENSHEVKVINFKCPLLPDLRSNTLLSPLLDLSASVPAEKFSVHASPYPEVDKFINSVVFPGKIWRSTYFNSSSTIVYDIVGNRYCENIRRQHKSNNVKYIVNLNNYKYYQKCHDPECSMFRSESVPLPPELKFKLEDEFFLSDEIDAILKDIDSSNNRISESDLLEAASVIEDLSNIFSDEES